MSRKILFVSIMVRIEFLCVKFVSDYKPVQYKDPWYAVNNFHCALNFQNTKHIKRYWYFKLMHCAISFCIGTCIQYWMTSFHEGLENAPPRKPFIGKQLPTRYFVFIQCKGKNACMKKQITYTCASSSLLHYFGN